MTRDEFNRRYQLIRRVSDGPVRTYHAFAARGTVVMVHEVDPEATDEAATLVALMAELPEAERARIVDVLDVDGHAMIVTRFLMDHVTLRGWLEAVARGAGPAVEEPEIAEESKEPVLDTRPADDEPGEFTRMFGVQQVPGAPDPELPTPDVRNEPVLDTPSTGEDEPGEFTRMFGARVAPAAGDTSDATGGTLDGDALDDTPRNDPRDVEALVADVPDEPPLDAWPAHDDEPGEFTRMFRAVVAPEAPTPEAPAPAEPAPEPMPDPTPDPATSGPGEFTKIFGVQSPPPPPTERPVDRTGGDAGDDRYRERLAGQRGRGSIDPFPAEPPAMPPRDTPRPTPDPLALPRAPDAPPPPGAYTRIVRAQPRPGSPEAPPPAPAAATPPAAYPPAPQPGAAPYVTQAPETGEHAAAGPSNRALFIGLAVIVALVVVLIVVVLLLTGNDPPAPADAPVDAESMSATAVSSASFEQDHEVEARAG